MNIEEIIAKEKDSPLFDEKIFLEKTKKNNYPHEIWYKQILLEIKKPNTNIQKELYSNQIFIDEKNKEYNTIISQIKQKYSSIDVLTEFDLEILEWVDYEYIEDEEEDEIQEGWEYEWYAEFGRREAESVIYLGILRDWESTYNNNKQLNDNDHCIILEKLDELYEL